MPKVQKERAGAAQRKTAPNARAGAAQRKSANATQAVRQSITFNKDFGQHILRVSSFVIHFSSKCILSHTYQLKFAFESLILCGLFTVCLEAVSSLLNANNATSEPDGSTRNSGQGSYQEFGCSDGDWARNRQSYR